MAQWGGGHQCALQTILEAPPIQARRQTKLRQHLLVRKLLLGTFQGTDFFVVDHNPELLLAVEKVWLFINHKTHKKWPSSDEKAKLESLMKETGVFHYIENYDRDWYDDYQTEWNKSIGKPDWNPNRWYMDTDYMIGDRMRR